MNQLIALYEKLPPFEQRIMQILSIAYIPLNQTRLKECLIKTGVKAPNGISFESVTRNEGFKLMRPALDQLLKLNLWNMLPWHWVGWTA